MAYLYTCPGCGARVESGDLIYPIPEVEEKILPGEPMPAGECRECGELVPADAGRLTEGIASEVSSEE